jgi:hypothetical protein
MAKLMRGRKKTVRNFVLMLAGGLALGYLAIMVIGNPIVAAQLIPNDTPVVLLGGSVTLGEHSSVASQNWQSVTPQTEYAAPAGSPIATIVVKNNPGDGDGDGSTDRLRIPIPPQPEPPGRLIWLPLRYSALRSRSNLTQPPLPISTRPRSREHFALIP